MDNKTVNVMTYLMQSRKSWLYMAYKNLTFDSVCAVHHTIWSCQSKYNTAFSICKLQACRLEILP